MRTGSEERKEEFIRKAKIVHASENIDYSKVVYKDNRTKVVLIDNDLDSDGHPYGEFEMTPSNFLKGQSHPRKRGLKISSSKRYNTEWFVSEARKEHGDLYDYSKTVYTGAHNKVIIIDPEYGEFEQEANSHLRGSGHPMRAILRISEAQKYSTEEFIELGKKIHPDADYDYSKVHYVDSRTNVDIICNKKDKNGKIHGLFSIMATNFMSGKGCPKCGNQLSYGEEEIAEFLSQYTTVERHNRNILSSHKEIDIYLPELRIGIEYNGCNFHSEKYGKGRDYHVSKTNEASEKGIRLIQIFEDEFVLHKECLLHKLKHIIGADKDLPRVNGWACFVEVIDKETAESFLEKYHIQGFVEAKLFLGAFIKKTNEMVAVMSFKMTNTDSFKWELTRYCSKWDYRYAGVASKLFTWFTRNYNPTEVKSFADRRWTSENCSNLYRQLGFKLEEVMDPNYRYYNASVDTVRRFHKFGFRKEILHRKFGLPLSMTEREMTEQLGYWRIWDCGLLRYVWP